MQRSATNNSNHIFKFKRDLLGRLTNLVVPSVIFLPIFINTTGDLSLLSESPQAGYFHISIFFLYLFFFMVVFRPIDISKWIFFICLLSLFTFSLLSPYSILVSIQYIFPAIVVLFLIVDARNNKYFYHNNFISKIVLTWSVMHLLSFTLYDGDYTKFFGFPIYQAYTYYPAVLYLWALVFLLQYHVQLDYNSSFLRRIFMPLLYLTPLILSVLSSRRVIVAQLILSVSILLFLSVGRALITLSIKYNLIKLFVIGIFLLGPAIFFYNDIGDGDFLRLKALLSEEFNSSGGRITNVRQFFSELSLSLLIVGTDTMPVESNFHNSLLDAVYRFGIGHGVLIFICLGLIYCYLWLKVPGKYRANVFALIVPASLLPIFLNSGFFQPYFFVNFVLVSLILPTALGSKKLS